MEEIKLEKDIIVKINGIPFEVKAGTSIYGLRENYEAATKEATSTGWTSADVECFQCGNIWTSLFEGGTEELECPKCRAVNSLPPNLQVDGSTPLWSPQFAESYNG